MTQQRYRTVLLFGAPGAGKGTQGKLLDAIHGFFHFSMGDAFRGLDAASELGRTVKGYSSRGELVPDDITFRLLQSSLATLIEQGRYSPVTDLLVLDGFPRNPAQAALLRDKAEIIRIVHLQCAQPDALVERLRKRALKENRADDAKEAVIRRRLEIYQAETQPVLDTFDADLIEVVDPIGTPAQVLLRVLACLAPLQARVFGNALEG